MFETIQKPTLNQRLEALLKTVLQSSKIGKTYHPIILKLSENFLSSVDETELREGIVKMRDEIIPWLLDDEN